MYRSNLREKSEGAKGKKFRKDFGDIMTKRCYNCKYRQKEVQPKRRLVCNLHDKEIDKFDICDDHEDRYPDVKKELR